MYEDLPVHSETSNNVVPENNFIFNATVMNRILETVDQLTNDGNHGIQHFLGLVNAITEQVQVSSSLGQ